MRPLDQMVEAPMANELGSNELGPNELGPNEQILVADDLVAGYLPDVDILNGCHIEVYRGELVGIIGPNGAGKSTLIKALFGLVPIRSGTVKIGRASCRERG